MSAVFSSLGVLLVILGFADFITAMFLRMDFSEVWWSPIVLGGVGSVFTMIGNRENKDSRLYKWPEFIVLGLLLYGSIIGIILFIDSIWGEDGVDRAHWIFLIFRLLRRR